MSEQITTVEDLDALPVGIVVRLAGGLVAEKRPTGRWAITAHRGPQDLRLYDLPATVLYRPDAPAPSFAITAEHIERQRAFSLRTFGPGARTAGVVDHIRKELAEVEAAPDDLSEWADVIILAFDGAQRTGADPQVILDAVLAKQERNEGRTWPDWRTQPTDRAIEHDRSPDAPASSDDPVSAPEWAVEKAARTLWIGEQESDKDRAAAARYWDDASIPDDVIERDYYRRQARAALDAVWPETTAEWGVKWPYRSRQPERVTTYRDRVAAEDAIKRQGRIYPGDGPGFLLRREVTPGEVTEWHEVLS